MHLPADHLYVHHHEIKAANSKHPVVLIHRLCCLVLLRSHLTGTCETGRLAIEEHQPPLRRVTMNKRYRVVIPGLSQAMQTQSLQLTMFIEKARALHSCSVYNQLMRKLLQTVILKLHLQLLMRFVQKEALFQAYE